MSGLKKEVAILLIASTDEEKGIEIKISSKINGELKKNSLKLTFEEFKVFEKVIDFCTSFDKK